MPNEHSLGMDGGGLEMVECENFRKFTYESQRTASGYLRKTRERHIKKFRGCYRIGKVKAQGRKDGYRRAAAEDHKAEI